jgi:hypothetical protein
MKSNYNKSKSTIYTIILILIIISFVGWIIITQIEEFKLQDDPKLKELKKIVEPLFSKDKTYSGVLSSLNNRDIMNEISLYKGDKSYTINKHKIFLCLKDENSEYYNNSMLIFVLLHEISHVLCPNIGHTEEFDNIFQAVLDEATKEGIYNPNIPVLQNYCNY